MASHSNTVLLWGHIKVAPDFARQCGLIANCKYGALGENVTPDTIIQVSVQYGNIVVTKNGIYYSSLISRESSFPWELVSDHQDTQV